MFDQNDLMESFLENANSEYDFYGLPVFKIGGCEYAIGTDEECEAAAKEYISDTVWAFNADFLACYMPEAITPDIVERIRGDSCEDANESLLSLIVDFDSFLDDAISADGRGHFLSSYGGEHEFGQWYVYRIN